MSADIRSHVESQVAEKINKGEALAQQLAAVEAAQQVLDGALRDVASARRDALAAGWTEAELKKLGLVPATRPARGRQVRAKARPAAEAERVEG